VRGDEGKVLVEEDAYLLLFLLLVLSDSELRRCELDLVDLGLPAQLSQLDVQLPCARTYEQCNGDAAASPRVAYSGAGSVAGVVVSGVIGISAWQRLAARCTTLTTPFANGSASSYMPSVLSAAMVEAGMNEYGRSELE
jgi:hypothetical protein